MQIVLKHYFRLGVHRHRTQITQDLDVVSITQILHKDQGLELGIILNVKD